MENNSSGRRAQVLNKIAEIMRSRFNELVELEILDTGKSLMLLKGKFRKRLKTLNFMQVQLWDTAEQ